MILGSKGHAFHACMEVAKYTKNMSVYKKICSFCFFILEFPGECAMMM